ncbi:MAG: sulfotransferase domain-containing protein, partial [Candidatus Aminicenantes bacterium]|nr:sulfotransferase domain-containing protein [Candidatus Aminicenantes bacterium]
HDISFHKLLANDKVLDKIIFEGQILEKIIENDTLMQKILLDQRVRDKIFKDVSLLDKILLDDRTLDRILSDIRFLDKILLDGRSIDRILGDERVLGRILTKEKALDRVLREQRFFDKLSGDIESLEKLFFYPRVLDKILSDEKVVQKILLEENNLKKIIELSTANDKIFNIMLRNKRLRDEFLPANLQKKVSKLNYLLPVFLVGFPRVGSNYLQNVLSASSGIVSQSLYAPIDIEPRLVLTYKTHAPSPEYLIDEVKRFLPVSIKPTKIITLKRDPRDTMISFYEYTQVERNIVLKQGDFLEKTGYFYASTIDRLFQRKVLVEPLSILEAFQLFVKKWFVEKPTDVEILELKYEDLVETPDAEFGRVFDFLELDCELDRESLDKRVSLYSQEPNRPRGKAYGWETVRDEYSQIIEQVSRHLKDEIKHLKYKET